MLRDTTNNDNTIRFFILEVYTDTQLDLPRSESFEDACGLYETGRKNAFNKVIRIDAVRPTTHRQHLRHLVPL